MSTKYKLTHYKIETDDGEDYGYVYAAKSSEAADKAIKKIIKKNNGELKDDMEFILMGDGHYLNFVARKDANDEYSARRVTANDIIDIMKSKGIDMSMIEQAVPGSYWSNFTYNDD